MLDLAEHARRPLVLVDGFDGVDEQEHRAGVHDPDDHAQLVEAKGRLLDRDQRQELAEAKERDRHEREE
jgi:hypothetical protein